MWLYPRLSTDRLLILAKVSGAISTNSLPSSFSVCRFTSTDRFLKSFILLCERSRYRILYDCAGSVSTTVAILLKKLPTSRSWGSTSVRKWQLITVTDRGLRSTLLCSTGSYTFNRSFPEREYQGV
uniref:Putative secreted peptide n=1 Tax=Anopheles braziliensis TaxID=58242 RepID=A0A2M3ZWJ8_9DIPT